MSDGQQMPREARSIPPGAYVAPGLRLVRTLGAGGQGRVVLAEDERLARSVAIKFLGGAVAERRPEVAARLRVEARVMAKVRHPSVVQVFDLGEAEGEPFLVMEYVQGETLEACLREREGGLDLAEAFALLEQIALGLAAVHEVGLAHGDLQPTNVLVGADSRARVVDFGLAFLSGGTAHYMAPELQSPTSPARDVCVRQRADLYALGVMAHELLAGRRPFEAPDRARVLAQHWYKAAPPLSERRPDLAESLASLVDDCLAKDPADRPVSAALVARGFADALHRLGRPAFRRVLLVDDDPGHRALIRAHVEAAFEDVQVEEATDGAQAIVACEQVSYDVIVFDLRMHEGDGRERVRELRADTRGARLLVLSGRTSASDSARERSLGAGAVLPESLGADGLIAALGRALYG